MWGCKEEAVLKYIDFTLLIFLQLKGADRKHKQDREKVLKRPPLEQEKFQPSYDCTVLNDVSVKLFPSLWCCTLV
jgi:hypothetical protein